MNDKRVHILSEKFDFRASWKHSVAIRPTADFSISKTVTDHSTCSTDNIKLGAGGIRESTLDADKIE